MFQQFMEKCGKLYFLSENDAKIKLIEREADRENWHGKTYQCPTCHYWHLSTVEQPEKIVENNARKEQRKIEIQEEQRSDEHFKKLYAQAQPVRDMIKKLDERDGLTQKKTLLYKNTLLQETESIAEIGEYDTKVSSALDQQTLNKLKKLYGV